MFAWAKNAPPTTLPQGVSFLVDPGQRRYLVLQVRLFLKRDKRDAFLVSDSLCQTTVGRRPHWSQSTISAIRDKISSWHSFDAPRITFHPTKHGK